MEKERVIKILKDYEAICKEIRLNKKILKDKFNNTDEGDVLQITAEKQQYLIDLKNAITAEINKLPPREKNIINEFYILKWQWVRIARFENYSQRRCRDYRDRGLKLLCAEFETNKIISNYK